MKTNDKEMILHKINIGISVGTELLIEQGSHVKIWNLSIILLLIMLALFGLDFIKYKIDLDVLLKDMSIGSTIFKYLCSFSLAGIIIYRMYEDSHTLLLILAILVVVIEVIAIFVIRYRYKILNKFKKIKRHKN